MTTTSCRAATRTFWARCSDWLHDGGLPNHGGPEDIGGEKSIVDWLNGRAPAYKAADVTSQQVVADWHNGSSAMIGKSYDGTLANGVAATGVDGLKTIVPVSAISAWYNYSRTGACGTTRITGAAASPTITTGPNPRRGVDLPNRRPLCADFNARQISTGRARRHQRVLARPRLRQGREQHRGLGVRDSRLPGRQRAHGPPRDVVARAEGQRRAAQAVAPADRPHGPFEQRRAEWVDTLHRWFDHYLHGVANGVETEPAVTIEDEKDVWHDYADWPVPGTASVNVFLRGTSQAAPGTFAGSAGGSSGANTLSFVGSNSINENGYISNPDGAQTNRRVFLSQPLEADVRLSGTARLDLKASLSTAQSNLGVLVVDYSDTPFSMVTRSGEGIQNTATRTCWGATSDGTPCTIGDTCTASPREVDTACYLEVSKPTTNVTQWRVTRGGLDSSNRDSLWYQDATPVTIGEKDDFPITTMPTEHTFKAGHRIGIIVTGHLIGQTSAIEGGPAATNGSVITVDSRPAGHAADRRRPPGGAHGGVF